MDSRALCFELYGIYFPKSATKPFRSTAVFWRTPDGRLPFGHLVNIKTLHPYFHTCSFISFSELPEEEKTSTPLYRREETEAQEGFVNRLEVMVRVRGG